MLFGSLLAATRWMARPDFSRQLLLFLVKWSGHFVFGAFARIPLLDTW